MEKISMNDIIAFIEKAMFYNKPIDANTCCQWYNMTIQNGDEWISFDLSDGELKITTSINRGHMTLKLTEKEILKFRLIFEECRAYQKENAIKAFSTFFDNESKEGRPTNIDDLNDED